MPKLTPAGALTLVFACAALHAAGQGPAYDLPALMAAAEEHALPLAELRGEARIARAAIPTARRWADPAVDYLYDANNLNPENIALHVGGLSHTFALGRPSAARADLYAVRAARVDQLADLERARIRSAVAADYNQLVDARIRLTGFAESDSLYTLMLEAAEEEHRDTDALQVAIARAERIATRADLLDARKAERTALAALRDRCGLAPEATVVTRRIDVDDSLAAAITEGLRAHYAYLASERSAALALTLAEGQPALTVGLFNGFDPTNSTDQWTPGVSAAMTLPVWRAQRRADRELAAVEIAVIEDLARRQLANRARALRALDTRARVAEEALEDLKGDASAAREALLAQGTAAFRRGELNQLEYLELLEVARTLRSAILQAEADAQAAELDAAYFVD